MKNFLSVVHLILCVLVMVVVLLQRRKEGGFGGAFGGGTQAETGQWQRFTGLTKLTIILFALLMLTSMLLYFVVA